MGPVTRKLVIPGAAFSGPKLVADPMERAGSLLLVEPAHPVSPWPVGLPIPGQTLPNVMSITASALGLTQKATWFFSGLTGAKGRVERTTLGGIHGIVSAATAVGSGICAGVNLPDDLIQYIISHPDHQYYYSMIDRQTRIGTINQTSRLLVGLNDNVLCHTYWYKSAMRPNSTWKNIWVGDFNTAASTVNTVPMLRSIGVKAWTSDSSGNPGTPPSSASEITHSLHWGSAGTVNTSFANTAGVFPSWVFYRLYIEDLTVSGISYAEALAQDKALTTALTASGGRYADDVFTDPVTIP